LREKRGRKRGDEGERGRRRKRVKRGNPITLREEKERGGGAVPKKGE